MFYLTALFVLALDQWTKFLVLAKISHQSCEVIKNILHITLVYNRGGAFGIFKGATIFFIIFAALASLAVTFFYLTKKTKSIILECSLGFILGGAISNLIDRVRFGCVIDFIDFRIWPVFNFADSAITIGVVLILFKLFMKETI